MIGLFEDSGIPKYEDLSKKLVRLGGLKNSRPLVNRRIVSLPGEGRGIFVGDLHGDFEAVVSIVKQTNFIKDMNDGNKTFLIFLGDYGDRGYKTLETINELITLKLLFPENVTLLMGNHEEVAIADEYGTYSDFSREYRSPLGKILFELYCEVMEAQPVMVITDNGIIAVHGGIPITDIKSIDDFKGVNGDQLLFEMKWNDPRGWISERGRSSRGDSCITFGKDAFERFMTAIRGNILVRSHEVYCDGVWLMFNRRLASIFSNGSIRSVSSAYKHLVTRPVYFEADLSVVKGSFEDSDFKEVLYI
jgi:serine/threonine-protein phosphatase PP1 catalytic subunit